MIIKSKQLLSLVASDSEQVYPVLPLMTVVLFPGMDVTIHVGRSENLALLEQVFSNKDRFVASYCQTGFDSKEERPIHQVGVLAEIRDIRDGAGDTRVVTLEGFERVALSRITRPEPYLEAVVHGVEKKPHAAGKIKEQVSEVIAIISEITNLDPKYSPELANVLRMIVDDPSRLADQVASTFHFSLSAKQELLETISLEERFRKLLHHLNGELNRAATVLSIQERVKNQIEEEQQKYFLRQQLHEIRKQLGEDFSEEKEVAHWKQLLKSLPDLPHEVADRSRMEIERLGQLSPASAEYGATKNYLGWILNLPWGVFRSEDYQMDHVQKVVDQEYFGPDNLKEQILQRLSVRKLMGGKDDGPALCLVGAPGTGKASMAKAIAKAIGKEFIRISVGGVTSVDDIKGTPRTFLGAQPGKIIRTLRRTGSCDPVVLLEDIDYFNIENNSSVNMALLEVIDARYNSRFLDQYIGVPFDFSKVFFVCSVRSYEEIPEQFVSRLEIVELPGYIDREKITIAKRYLLPDLLTKHGLKKTELKISDRTLSKIISGYTMEAGLLGLSQQIERICRKVALKKAEKSKRSLSVNEKTLESFLGTPPFIPEKAETLPEIGNAAGLAWTGAGGELMFIEGLKMKGDGQIITTGSLGEVMRESIQAAHSYVRSKADLLGIDFNDFNEFDIHIHFPSGAIPKDGPSAGITVCLVIASVMSERPIRNDIAMTGEVTLRGKVLSVGGTKEKISAAYRAGIHNVVLPKENEKDLKELPREIIRKTRFHFVESVDQLFELCLLDFKPSAYTLEKIFAEEIAKAKKRPTRKKRVVRKSARKSK
ncbi:MAG: endopeptidase La [candidate division Zixibacteria bacterium]|nr:endopeptidase La [candidate division Zixibacteria bacterium]